MSSTHRLTISKDRYTNASGGNNNCTVFGYYQLQLVIAASEPPADTADYVRLSNGNAVSFTDLEEGDSVWLRARDNNEEIAVIRGPVRISL